MKRLAALIGTIITALTLAAYWVSPGGIRQVEEALFDQYQRWAPRPYNPAAPVRLVDIDETSLQKLGQWPWPRSDMARLTQRLFEMGAGAVAFDILFAEPDRTSPVNVIEGWRRAGFDLPVLNTEDFPDNDALFTKVLSAGPSVLAVAGTSRAQIDIAQVPKAGISIVGNDPTAAILAHERLVGNLPMFTEAATGLGLISLDSKSRVIRAVPLVAKSDDRLFPALTMELLRVAQGAGGYLLKTTGAQGEDQTGAVQVAALRVGAIELPVTAEGHLRIYYSGSRPERIVPAWQIMQDDTPSPALAERIAGHLVIIGASAEALGDLVTTPLSTSAPGMEVHAELLEQALDGKWLTRPDWAAGLEGLGVLLFGLVATILGAMQRPVLALAGSLFLIPGAAWASWFAFDTQSLLVSPVFPVAAAGMIYVSLTALGILLKERERRAVRNQFAHFIPGELIEQIAADPDAALTPSGAERELSVMFIDVRKFSTITETMDPETVVRFVNDFLTPLSDMILDRGGTIDKFIGDAIMAFWNAPMLNTEHRVRAIEAALAMPDVLARINADNTARGLPAIEAGAGVNTGACSVGFMGSHRRLGYTTIGDPVNLASRLEGLTKTYGAINCLGEATIAGLDDRFAFLPIDVVAVKGRTRPEPISTVVGGPGMLRDEHFVRLRDALASAQSAYAVQDWDRAASGFSELMESRIGAFSCKSLCSTYLARISAFRVSPPPMDWSGVHIATEK